MSDNKKTRFLQKLKNKYRLVILNDATFEERIVITITPLLILFVSLVVSFFMIFSTFLLFSYTPLKEYVPGKTSLETQKELISISLQVDSLIALVEARDLYIKNLKIILNGGVPIEKEEVLDLEDDIKTEDLESSNHDSLFREKIEKKSSGDYINNSKNASIHFFSPVSGEFTQEYSLAKKHFGVDLVTKKDAIISSVADGKIILSDHYRRIARFYEVLNNYKLMKKYYKKAFLSAPLWWKNILYIILLFLGKSKSFKGIIFFRKIRNII